MEIIEKNTFLVLHSTIYFHIYLISQTQLLLKLTILMKKAKTIQSKPILNHSRYLYKIFLYLYVSGYLYMNNYVNKNAFFNSYIVTNYLTFLDTCIVSIENSNNKK